jgi:hypothetical protein
MITSSPVCPYSPQVLGYFDEVLEAAVHRHNFADLWGGRGEVCQVCERVEKGQRS